MRANINKITNKTKYKANLKNLKPDTAAAAAASAAAPRLAWHAGAGLGSAGAPLARQLLLLLLPLYSVICYNLLIY